MCDPFTVAETEIQRTVHAHLHDAGLSVTRIPTFDLAVIICRAIADNLDAPHAHRIGHCLRASLPADSAPTLTTKGPHQP